MTRRMTLAATATAALAASAVAAGPAAAQKGGAKDNGARIVVVGGTTFKAGVSVTDNQRFSGTTTARPGATIRIANRAKTDEPHTVSIVARRDLPRSFAGMAKPIFGQLMQAHGMPDGPGQPANPLVNVGTEGFGEPGDSLFFAGKSASLKLAADAKRGTTLSYLCLLHPWMQGSIRVR